MIAAPRGASRGCSGALAGEPAGQVQRLVEIGEADLARDLLPLRPHLDLVANRGLELVGGVAQRRLGLGAEAPSPHLRLFWLAGQLNPVLGLANRPPPLRRVAGEAAADVVAGSRQQRPAMALAELARLEQLERLVGKVQQPDQVGDGGTAATDAAGQVLFGEAEVLDQSGAGTSLLDRVEVLADHVLD